MCAIVRDAIAAGAGGLSTSSTSGHYGAGGRPVPSRIADEREHLALCRAIVEAGRGLWQGNIGTLIMPEFALKVLAETGVPTHEINPGVLDPTPNIDLFDLGYTTYGQMPMVPNI